MTRTDFYDDPNAPAPTRIIVGVSAFVQNDAERLLLMRRSDLGQYALPGGRHEPGETLTQSVVREVLEETNISVSVVELIGVYSDPNHVIVFDDEEPRQEFTLCFRARVIGGTLKAGAEADDVQWVDRSKVDKLDIQPSNVCRIEHGFAQRSAPYFS